MATVGYEALVRGPVGSRFASAASLVEAAYRTGHVIEFDWAARASASRTAMAKGLATDLLLFLNVEPLALDTPCPRDLWPDIERAFAMFRVVLEVTERSLDRDPRSLLNGIAQQRPEVEALALDDVGSTTKTLAMLPVLSPDVIKLDISVTQGGMRRAAMKILDIAYEESERTGATILAEGIETAAQSEQARRFGASLGQGHHLDRPGSLARDLGHCASMPSVVTETVPDVRTPFEALGGRTTGRATADMGLCCIKRSFVAAPANPPLDVPARRTQGHSAAASRRWFGGHCPIQGPASGPHNLILQEVFRSKILMIG